VRTTSYERLEKILLQYFTAENVDVHLYNFFSTRRYIAQTAIVKFRIGSPKTARNEQVCAHQKSYKKILENLHFPKSFLSSCIQDIDCSCAPILRFSLWRQMAPQQRQI